jgi:ABC-type glycerol-3-phosphate transport system permease component
MAPRLLELYSTQSLDGMVTMAVPWKGRTVDARRAWGEERMWLTSPGGGLEVPANEIRVEERVRRYATIDGARHEVRVLTRDAERGVAVVELLDQPQTRCIEASRLERVERPVYTAEILGDRQIVEPLTAIELATEVGSGIEGRSTSGPLPNGRGSAGDAHTTSRPHTNVAIGADASPDPRFPIPDPRIPVHVPGAIAVAADLIRTETPLAPQWSNYAAAWAEQEFDLYVVNTLFIAALVVLGTVISCGLVGYAFARYEFRGRNLLFLLLLSTMMIPAQVTAIPTFVLFAKFGWIDSFKPLIVPHFLAHSAFFVFLFRQFMLTIPADLEDSARIDGCGPLQTWWLIMMPLCRPIVITVAVFSFIYVWNDFLYPLLYINSDEKQTVALGLQSFKSAYAGAEPQLIMAASVMMIIPTVLLFFVAQKAFMRGVVVSGVKG